MTEDRIPAELPLEQLNEIKQTIKRANRQMLLEARERSGLSERRFATEILGRDERTYRGWKEGKPVSEAAMKLIRRIHADQLDRMQRKMAQGDRSRKASLEAAIAKRDRKNARRAAHAQR